MNEVRVDTELRRTLTPAPADAARVAERALRQASKASPPKVLAIAVGSLAAATLLTLALLRPHSGPPARATEVFSVGGLVVGVPATGSTWIVGPDAGTDADQPRTIVMRGEAR